MPFSPPFWSGLLPAAMCLPVCAPAAQHWPRSACQLAPATLQLLPGRARVLLRQLRPPPERAPARSRGLRRAKTAAQLPRRHLQPRLPIADLQPPPHQREPQQRAPRLRRHASHAAAHPPAAPTLICARPSCAASLVQLQCHAALPQAQLPPRQLLLGCEPGQLLAAGSAAGGPRPAMAPLSRPRQGLPGGPCLG